MKKGYSHYMHYCRLIIALVFMLSLSSCEREVHIDLGTTPPKVVVQGAIETNSVPYVVLTSTISFFATVDLSTLEKSFLHNANITVSDGSKTITLREYSIDTGAGNKFYIYTIDTANLANIIKGESGKSYALSITYGGNTYSAVTVIPNPRGVDSVWFAEPTFKRDKTPATARQLFVNYTDPDTTGDAVRYFTKRGNQDYYPSGIFTDEGVNGKTVNNIALEGGYQSSSEDQNRDSLIYFFPGETVSLKWCSIDKPVYTFWNSLQFAKNAVGNPFSSPINVISNISNGALGVWAGYGSKIYTRVVPN